MSGSKGTAVMLGLAVLLAGCKKQAEFQPYDNTAERAAFYERYNKEVEEKLNKSIEKLENELAGKPSPPDPPKPQAGDKNEGADKHEEDADETPQTQDEKVKLLADMKRHAQHPKYFEFLKPQDLPQDLKWETNLDDPEVGSPKARKGGTERSFFQALSFPPTIRTVGNEANVYFRSQHQDYVEMGLVSIHPNTGNSIPALADKWAVTPDKQTVYYHIDEAARWSDGKKVTSRDFVMFVYIALSPYLTETFYRNFYNEQFWGFTTYGDDYLCIRLATPKPRPEAAATFWPYQEDFYREFGPDFERRYNWRTRPVTGPYQILPDGVDKGRSITLSRVKNWWAKDRLYYRNCYNPDQIKYLFVRDMEKVFEMFRRGEIDIFPIAAPKYWYEKSEIPAVFNGYIEKTQFYNEYPRVPRGLYFNLNNPLLANRDIRIGVEHATNWQKVIDFDLRGDASRLNLLNEGYGRFSNPNIKAREFSPEKARASFAKAGFTRAGADGILVDGNGRRLSLTITYSKREEFDQYISHLKEEAAKAGLAFEIESLDDTTAFQKMDSKNHDIAFTGWGTIPPYPNFFEFMHSKEAFMPGTRKPRPATNNYFSYGDPATDVILEENRAAASEDSIMKTSYRLEEIIHDEALWSPGYQKDFYRTAYWRWVGWPDDFNCKISDEPEMTYVHWIDEDKKRETLEAMKEGKKFPEVNHVYDQYRVKQGGQP